MYIIPIYLKFLNIWYFHIHLTTTVRVDEMYENLEEITPKITIFDHNTIIIKS